jgi:hypothetical protein
MNPKLPKELHWRADRLDSIDAPDIENGEFWSDLICAADQMREAAHEIERLRTEIEHLRAPRNQWWVEQEAEEGDRANG